MEEVRVNIGKREQRSPEFLAVNPLGKLPAMQVSALSVAIQLGLYISTAQHFPHTSSSKFACFILWQSC